jgi:hypothetical protein
MPTATNESCLQILGDRAIPPINLYHRKATLTAASCPYETSILKLQQSAA